MTVVLGSPRDPPGRRPARVIPAADGRARLARAAEEAARMLPIANEPEHATTRVLIADDQTLFRAGIRSLLERERDVEVIGETGDGARALHMVAAGRPDVVLMDVRLAGLDGIEATRRIVADERLAGVAVIVISAIDLDDYVYGAITAGARGFLLKDTEPGLLALGVRAVARGGALLSPCVARRVLDVFAVKISMPPDHTRLRTLTGRETEVLRLIALGLSNEEIANRLVITVATAKTHVSRVLTKLAARDRAQLVRLAYESGMVRPLWLTCSPSIEEGARP